MNMQKTLLDIMNSIKQHNMAHARRLSRLVREVSADIYVDSLAYHTIRDINLGDFHSAFNDARTAKIIDERNSYSMVL